MRTLNKTLLLPALLIGIGLASGALAQNEVLTEDFFAMGNELGVGARAIGLGGAYTGVADDYSAMYWNPAGLAQVRRMELNFGFSHNSVKADAAFLDTQNEATNSFTRLNALGFVFPVPTYRGSLVFGVGYNKVRDFDAMIDVGALVRSPNGTAFADVVVPTYDQPDSGIYWHTEVSDSLFQSKSILDEGSRNQFTFSGALEVQENLFVGASINFISGRTDRSFEFKEEDIYDLYNYFDYDTHNMSDLKYWTYTQDIASEVDATNLKLGLFYRSEKNWRLGATLTTPTTYKIKENWSWNQEEYYDTVADASVLNDAGEYEYKYSEPYAFSIGASAKLLDMVLLSGDVEFKDWTQAKFDDDPPVSGMDQSKANRAIKKEMQATTKLHAGAEFYVPAVSMRLRGGYYFDPSPYKNAAIRPDRTFYSGGASFMLDKQVMLDLAYVRGSWKETSSDNLTAEAAQLDRTLQKIVGTISLRF
jgi:long-subunit fatty acid transport protein